MSTKAIPDGYDALIPSAIVRDAAQMGAFAPQPGTTPPPAGVMIYVQDVDAVFNKALAKGAKSMMSPKEMFLGDRYGKFVDPFGHLWGVATHKKDLSQEEMAQGAAQWGKQHPA